ncbi:autotransporter domain-containing protein [uncultured Pseudodesulfovibrio sp.]|uniref:autotransporter domain-containing protein n=1 Tax=uncultured Pseudodesulfovibrio sp. TaxID=2035858 RepID=UPI0029C96B95|nr:autotransporter domain-containing protein [uncultured Pseudodesulfovibrio sp.]
MLHAPRFHSPFKLYRVCALALQLLLILLLGSPVLAAGLSTKTGSDPVVSPDGGSVAYFSYGSEKVTRDNFDSSAFLTLTEVYDLSSDGKRALGYNSANSKYYLVYSWDGFTSSNCLSDVLTDMASLSAMTPDGLTVGGVDSYGSIAVWTSPDRFWSTATKTTTNTKGTINALKGSSDGTIMGVGASTSNKPRSYQFLSGGGANITTLSLVDGSTTYTSGVGQDVSADCQVGVGHVDAGFGPSAARWDLVGNVLTVLPGAESSANAVNSDGTVIVGSTVSQAAVWTGADSSYTLATLYDVLTGKGVTVSNDAYLVNATGLSDDGTIIVGTTNTGRVFIANVSGTAGGDSGGSGVITVGELDQSLGAMGQVGPSVANMGQLSMSRLGSAAVGQGMHFSVTGTGTGGAPSAAGAETGLSSGDDMPGRLDLWMIGSVGTNIELNGDDLGLHGGIGLSWDNGGQWRFGAGLFGDDRDLDTDHGGNQRIKALGPGAFVVYTPEGTGLQFRVSALWQPVDLKLKRGYANGAGSATSTGSTDADVFGLSARAQWTKAMTDSLAVTPFAEYTWESTHIDGYSESGGPFPASYGSRTETSNSIRTGLRADFALFANLETWAWGAWNHRFEDTSSGLGGTAVGLGSFSYPGSKIDQDWADVGVGVTRQFSERLTSTASLGGAIGCDDDSVSDLTATIGFSYQLW